MNLLKVCISLKASLLSKIKIYILKLDTCNNIVFVYIPSLFLPFRQIHNFFSICQQHYELRTRLFNLSVKLCTQQIETALVKTSQMHDWLNLKEGFLKFLQMIQIKLLSQKRHVLEQQVTTTKMQLSSRSCLFQFQNVTGLEVSSQANCYQKAQHYRFECTTAKSKRSNSYLPYFQAVYRYASFVKHQRPRPHVVGTMFGQSKGAVGTSAVQILHIIFLKVSRRGVVFTRQGSGAITLGPLVGVYIFSKLISRFGSYKLSQQATDQAQYICNAKGH